MSARVLVVDDILPNVKLLEAKLTSEYYDVLTATSGKEALEKVKVGAAGQVQHEPKLEARKYRRISRRSRHQAMDDLKLDLTDVESFEDLDDDELEDLGF